VSSHRKPLIERAYELARSGQATSFSDIVAILKRERYDDIAAQLGGPVIRHALRKLCAEADAGN